MANLKTELQKKVELEAVAKAIVNLLNEKRIYNSNNKTQLKEEYDKLCKSRSISAYKNYIIDFLDLKKCLFFNGSGCSIKPFFSFDEIFNILLAAKTRLNENKKSGSEFRKTRIKRTINRTKQENQPKLIPLNNVKEIIEKIGIEKIVESLRKDFGLEITAKEITIREY